MRTSWEPLQSSIVSIACGAMLFGTTAPAWAGRPVERVELHGAETIDLENFGLLPQWTAPVRILNRTDEVKRSLAVFKLAQVIAPQPAEDADEARKEKPAFRLRLPKVRETELPSGESVEEKPGDPPPIRNPQSAIRNADAAVPEMREGKLDLRERDRSERPSLLQPSVGSWLGDVPLVQIQTPAQPAPIPPPVPPAAETSPTSAAQPQVIPPPVPPEPITPPLPANEEVPKPQLFPGADSPTDPFPIPWEPTRGSQVTPAEAEPETETETEPKPPEELRLRRPTTQWDLAELEGPLFGTEDIAEFTRKSTASGRWAVRPHFSLTTLYDGNVFLDEAGQESDFIVNASPGVTLRLGNDATPLFLTADYTLGAVFFTSNDDQNSINHNGRLELDYRGARLNMGLRLGVENDSGTSIDATDRVRRTAYGLGFVSQFQYSEKVSFDMNADYRRSFYENLIGSEDYGFQGYVNYHYSPKFSVGLGGGITASEVEGGRSQQAQNISLKANWTATGKLSLEGSIGVGFYQFDNGEGDAVSPIGSLRATYVATAKLTFSADLSAGINRFDSDGDSVSPTFGIAATWAIWEGTVLTFDAHRRVFNSVVFTDQNYNSTGLIIGLQQQLGIRFTAFVTAGYENLEYTSAGAGVEATRNDDYFFARFGLQWHAFSRCSFGAFYEISQNSSSGQGARDFRRDRMGFQVSVTF